MLNEPLHGWGFDPVSPAKLSLPIMPNSLRLTARRHRRTKAVSGFTLIELLIVIAIIMILAAVAIPQYSAYKSKSVDATMHSDLKNATLAMESYYTTHYSYPPSIAVLTASGYISSPGVGISITLLTANSYSITAAASGGTQPSFTLDSVTGAIN